VQRLRGGGRDRSQLRGQLRPRPDRTSWLGGGALTSLVKGRAPRATFSATSRNSQGRRECCSRRSGPPGRCRRAAGRAAATLSATGSASPRPRSHQLARGGGALTSLVKVAASARDLFRNFRNSQGRRDAARGDRAAWAVQRLRGGGPRRSQLRGQLRHDPIAPAGLGGGALTSLSQGSRGRAADLFPQLPQLSGPGAMLLEAIGRRLGGAAAAGRAGRRRSQLRGQLRHDPIAPAG